ncbi:hypothetical protein G9A89_003656, partial [Geosiphon pyriformis]
MAAVDILLVAVVDKLESDILVLNKLAAASLASKCFDFALDFDIDLEFGISDWDFDVDFPIVSYKCCSWLLFGLVYHSCGRHVSLAATADCLMLRNALNFGNNCSFSDYCVFREVDKWTDVAVPKSGWDIGDQIPDGVGDCDLNPSKYVPYGP